MVLKMNRAKRNVIVVGFSPIERNSLSIPYIENGKVFYLDSMEEAKRHQGYLLIYDNKNGMSIVDFDKRYRKVINKYEVIFIFNESYEWEKPNKWSRIEKVDRGIFMDIGYNLSEEWDDYKLRKEKEILRKEFNFDKLLRVNVLYSYLKGYRVIKTEKISKDLNLSARTIERYMHDINSIYHNVGYDYSNKEWYLIW